MPQVELYLVEDPGVEPGVHALAGPPGGEAASATHHHVQHAEGDEVRVLRGAN